MLKVLLVREDKAGFLFQDSVRYDVALSEGHMPEVFYLVEPVALV